MTTTSQTWGKPKYPENAVNMHKGMILIHSKSGIEYKVLKLTRQHKLVVKTEGKRPFEMPWYILHEEYTTMDGNSFKAPGDLVPSDEEDADYQMSQHSPRTAAAVAPASPTAHLPDPAPASPTANLGVLPPPGTVTKKEPQPSQSRESPLRHKPTHGTSTAAAVATTTKQEVKEESKPQATWADIADSPREPTSVPASTVAEKADTPPPGNAEQPDAKVKVEVITKEETVYDTPRTAPRKPLRVKEPSPQRENSKSLVPTEVGSDNEQTTQEKKQRRSKASEPPDPNIIECPESKSKRHFFPQEYLTNAA